MYVLITYDVKTKEANGQKRLRQVARICEAHGQRVQNSVFECSLTNAQLVDLKHELVKIIDCGQDSLRIYRLGNNYRSKIEHIGVEKGFHLDEPLVF
jgi:CRISPR-associated protein Cas2